MTYLPSLPPDAVLPDVFRARPEIYRPLIDYHQALLRGPSPLSEATSHGMPSSPIQAAPRHRWTLTLNST